MKLDLMSAEKVQEWNETDVLSTTVTSFSLIVWNDNVNTFEWVIQTLIQICGHTTEQAEQCAYIIHYHGKYAVKQGDYETLQPMRDSIIERGINATIEEMVEQ